MEMSLCVFGEGQRLGRHAVWTEFTAAGGGEEVKSSQDPPWQRPAEIQRAGPTPTVSASTLPTADVF